jgi:hypothetical protein
MQACPEEFGRYQNRKHGGNNLKRGGEMAINPMGLIFTKFHPKTSFVSMDGALLGVGSLWQKIVVFKSLLQPIIVLRQSSVDDTTHP